MPSAKILEQKKQIVSDLTDKLRRASAGVFVDYRGITVEEDTKLRAEMRKAGVDYAVVKNTLTRFAAKDAGLEGLDEILNGTTALAVSYDDPVAPAKILNEYAAKHENFKIKMGVVEGKVITPAEVKDLADLPSREVLIATVLGTMNAPVTGLVTVLNGTIKGLAVALNAIAEKKAE